MMKGLKISLTICTTKKFKKFLQNNLTYQHRLIDDMVACLMKWSGGFMGM